MADLHPLYQEVLASGDAYLGDDGVVRVSKENQRWRHWHKDYPLVIDASGTRLQPYKRVTTHIKTTDSGGPGLTQYEVALILQGLRREPKLWRQIRELLDPTWTYDDIKAVEGGEVWALFQELTKAAKLKGGGDEATAWGDLIHKLTEEYEKHGRTMKPADVLERCNGQLVRYRETLAHSRGSAAPSMKLLVNNAMQDLEAYATAMAPFEVVAQEFFVVNDDLETAGSGDCLIEYGPMPELLIGDKKTGKNAMNYLGAKSMQKAEYAHGTPYSFTEGRLSWDDPISDRWGLLIAMPGDGRCVLNWVNIAWGWDEIVQTFPVVEAHKDYRTQKGLIQPFRAGELPYSNYVPRVQAPKPQIVSAPEVTIEPPLRDEILAQIASPDMTLPGLKELWMNVTGGVHPHPEWTDEINKAAAARKAELTAQLDAAGTKPQAA